MAKEKTPQAEAQQPDVSAAAPNDTINIDTGISFDDALKLTDAEAAAIDISSIPDKMTAAIIQTKANAHRTVTAAKQEAAAVIAANTKADRPRNNPKEHGPCAWDVIGSHRTGNTAALSTETFRTEWKKLFDGRNAGKNLSTNELNFQSGRFLHYLLTAPTEPIRVTMSGKNITVTYYPEPAAATIQDKANE